MTTAQARVHGAMSKTEFIALIAMFFASVAFSVDAMLPALGEIGRELSPDAPNRAQLILTSLVLGMGVGTFFTGPLSDAFGRRSVIFGGAAVYIVACLAGWASSSLEVVLAARLAQGVAVAAPRVVGMAIVRDLHSGREMARIMSFAMMVFTLFPAFAPLIGSGIIALTGWRGIFLAFILFSLVAVGWMGLRLPETLPPANRRPFRPAPLLAAIAELFGNPTVRLSIAAQTLCLGMLFSMLSMVQPVYDVIFGRADVFAYWFFGVAIVSGSASLLNAALVVHVGMRRMVTWSLVVQVALSAGMLSAAAALPVSDMLFHVFVAYQIGLFFMAGTTLGNLNAIAMEPMGHIAGMAASVMGGIATVGAVVIAAPLGQFFDGTVVPLAGGILAAASLALGLMLWMGRIEHRDG